ncbi:MAG TPA: ABC transporter ATP-binding protein, partial [bacterium]|nr:ABC transporter ATP-binding protein [bacterium]
MSVLLEVENLQTHFASQGRLVKAVDGVSFHVNSGETLAIVGESGSGKSVTALSIMRLVRWPPGRVVGGSVRYQGQDLLALKDEQMRSVRGKEMAMVFQEPMTSLNPVLSIGEQLVETLAAHTGMSNQASKERATEVMTWVGISDPVRRLAQYPHQFSGGMRQRVMIAMALICSPKLILADEPTTALDVTIQAQILELMRGLNRRFGVALVLITHNLGVVARYADRVHVMYAGR